MKLLKFSVKLKTNMDIQDIIPILNDFLDSSFELAPTEVHTGWTEWVCHCFGLEFAITYFNEEGEYIVSGSRSEKVAHQIPLEVDLEYTDISEEMLNTFNIILPEENWYL